VIEKARESVSAFVDEEISEIELHRLLRQYGSEPSVKASFISYQQIRSIIRRDSPLSGTQHMELHSRICAAIADESVAEFATAKPEAPKWIRPAAGFAIAASLVVAVTVGFNYSGMDGQQTGEFANAIPDKANSVDVRVQPASTDGPSVAGYQEATESRSANFPALRELDEEKQRQLRRYLNQHDRSRMNPYQLPVNYKQPVKKN
jgi:negative regulator of sigma E activity